MGSRFRRTRFALVVASLTLSATVFTTVAADRGAAATGDVLESFNASTTAGVPYCSINTGLAFDGENLIVSCWSNASLHFVDASTHQSAGSVTIPHSYGNGYGALAYDAGRDRLWACAANMTTVLLLDLTTGTIDPSVAPISTMGCIDGLAYDGSDDTLWSSHDVSMTIQNYALDGALISSQNAYAALGGSCGSSGIAVGGPDLFLGNNGCSEVWRANKDLSESNHFATLGARVEDMECDDRTFPGKGAMWVQDAYDRILTAYEIEPDLCRFGGGAAAASAESYAARVRVDPVPFDSGTLARSVAGVDESGSDSIAANDVPGVVAIEVGTTYAEGANDSDTETSASAVAKVTGLSLLGGLVTADVIKAKAGATFDRAADTGDSTSEGSILAGLVVNGTPIEHEVEPNTTIEFPGVATIVLREEIPGPSSMRVNMIHITSADGSTEVVVSSAFASAGPGSAAPEPAGQVLPELPEPPGGPPGGLPKLPGEAQSFDNGFEDGDDAWATSGSWQIGEPSGGHPEAPQGSQAAGTNLGGNYPNNDNAVLTSPTIDLTAYDPNDDSPINPYAGTKALLTYQQTFSSESYYDCGFIEASVDGGENWSKLTPLEGYNYAGWAWCGGASLEGVFSGYNLHASWTAQTLDLTPLAGKEVTLRFVFRSDGSVVATGWYLDDFALFFEESE